ncbi:hypothetical protein LSG23_20510 (plasmid) [Bacillus velezensis]|uniref:hypothetical protein n=1 Tax=Bacillus velezensis TaxID=492670 RepID=UPI000987D930|nr:hypothetical protein [Bacillus velezensis]AQS42500.1 hypothetical protein BVH55_00460 [Bacillus velezensis]WNR83208.1 hypothetical protein RP314_20820 [Bacillus velezensis]
METKEHWESLMNNMPEDVEGIEIFRSAEWGELENGIKDSQEKEMELSENEGLKDDILLYPVIKEDILKAYLEENISIKDVPDYQLEIENVTYREENSLYIIELKDGGEFTVSPDRLDDKDYNYQDYLIYFTKIPEHLQFHEMHEAEDLLIRFKATDIELKENINYFKIVDRNFDKEPSPDLERITMQNMTNENFVNAGTYLKNEIEKQDVSYLTKQDIQGLLSNHLEKVEEILAEYKKQKNQSIPWKNRFNSFKSNLKKSYFQFRATIREKIQAIKNTPVNLKNKAKNKIIDRVVSVNNKIVDKTNTFTRNMEMKRPENQSKSNIIDNYKREYKKHLINNYFGNEYQSEVNKILINNLDSQLTNKPHLSLRLRQEAINELNNDVLKGKAENLNIDLPKFKAYLEDKSELLTHGLMYFEEFQQKELLTEDLKFNVYQEPEKKISQNDNVSVKGNQANSESEIKAKELLEKFNFISVGKESYQANSESEIKAKELLEKYFNSLDIQEKEKYKFDSTKFDKETNKLTLNYNSIRDPGYTTKHLEVDLKSGNAKEINKWVEDERGNWVTKSSVENTFNIYSQFNEKGNSNNLHAEKEEELER